MTNGAGATYLASNNIAIGSASLVANTTGYQNVSVGTNSLTTNTTGNLNTATGGNAAYFNLSGSSNSAFGNTALYNNSTGSNNIALGSAAGKYELGSLAFYINAIDRTDTAGDKAKSIIYGVMHATAASQTLKFNALLTIGVAIPAFVASDKYLIVDSNGNIHVSALGPLS
jgi:hypothetical protein